MLRFFIFPGSTSRISGMSLILTHLLFILFKRKVSCRRFFFVTVSFLINELLVTVSHIFLLVCVYMSRPIVFDFNPFVLLVFIFNEKIIHTILENIDCNMLSSSYSQPLPILPQRISSSPSPSFHLTPLLTVLLQFFTSWSLQTKKIMVLILLDPKIKWMASLILNHMSVFFLTWINWIMMPGRNFLKLISWAKMFMIT